MDVSVSSKHNKLRHQAILFVMLGAILIMAFLLARDPWIKAALFSRFTTSNFQTIRLGMRLQQVRAILGAPHDVTNGPTGATIWVYYDGISPNAYYLEIIDNTVIKVTIED